MAFKDPDGGTHVCADDLGIFLICTTRYALTRLSYIPTLARSLILKYGGAITKSDLRIIAESIAEEERTRPDWKQQPDWREWDSVRRWIEEQLSPAEDGEND